LGGSVTYFPVELTRSCNLLGLLARRFPSGAHTELTPKAKGGVWLLPWICLCLISGYTLS